MPRAASTLSSLNKCICQPGPCTPGCYPRLRGIRPVTGAGSSSMTLARDAHWGGWGSQVILLRVLKAHQCPQGADIARAHSIIPDPHPGVLLCPGPAAHEEGTELCHGPGNQGMERQVPPRAVPLPGGGTRWARRACGHVCCGLAILCKSSTCLGGDTNRLLLQHPSCPGVLVSSSGRKLLWGANVPSLKKGPGMSPT